MQLRRVEVRNIRSYVHARLDLESGTTLLVGDVGSGKTSLLYAVEMALFGTAEIEATFLVRHGATEATASVALEEDGHLVEVERTFRRVRRKGRETFEPGRLAFRRDGAATTYSATELRQQVIQLLGFRDNPNPRAHSDLWRWAVYVPQEQMREILAAPPLERLETVRKALGVERYHLAAENAKEVARDLRQSAAALRVQATTLQEFAGDLERAVGEVRRLGEERERADASLRAADAELVTARGRGLEAERRLQELESVRTRVADLARDTSEERLRFEAGQQRGQERHQEVSRASAEIQELATLVGQESERRKDLEAAEQALATRRTEAEQRQLAQANWAHAQKLRETRSQERVQCQQDGERLRAEIAHTTQVLSEVEAEGTAEPPLPPTDSPLPEVDSQLVGARAAEQAAREEAALAHRGLAELQELIAGGVCPRCHQTVDPAEFAPHEAEARTALLEAERRTETAAAERDRLERLRRERESYEKATAAWQAREDRRRDLVAAVQAYQTTLGEVDARLRIASDAIAEVDRQVEALGEPARELAEARAQLAEAERRVQSTRGSLEEVHRAAERRHGLEERLESLRAEDERAAHDAAEMTRRREERDLELVGLKERLSTEGEARAEVQVARSELTAKEAERHRWAEERGRLAGLWEGALKDQRRAEAARVERDRLLHHAETVDSKGNWLATAFHDAVLTMEKRVLEHAQAEFERNFRTYFAALMDDPDLVAVTDPTFSPAAEIRGVETPAEALSGGERTSLALAYRLALSKVVRALGGLRFDALLLDEPTDGFSPEQVQSMGQLLEELHLPQVVLVSHERELEGVADRVVLVEKENGVSVLRDSKNPAEPETATAEPST